jgi:predicted transcriptional regulator
MKRDLDLLRNIMIYLEDNLAAGENIESTNISLYDGSSNEEYKKLSEHIKLLIEDGLIETSKPMGMGGFTIFMILRITSKGHDFLDALRNDTVWNNTKEKMKEIGGFTLGVALDIAKGYFTKLINQ